MTEDWEGGTLEESGKLEDPRYRCPHGTYVGDPYGPDYMCFWCEMGISDEEYEEYRKSEIRHHRRRLWYDAYCARMVGALKSGVMPLQEFERRLHRVGQISRRYTLRCR